LRWS
jgi:hypothetical protein